MELPCTTKQSNGTNMFHFIVYVNGSIIQGENGAYFYSDASLMFQNNRVSTLYELKQVILSHLGADGSREIRRLSYRFQAVTPDDRLEYCPSWLSEDRHVWITFEVHRRIMQDRFMEFLAEVRHVGRSSGFCAYQLPADPVPINVVPPDYNSDEDSDYDDESSGHSTDEDELVPNTPAAGGPRLVLPAPKPIPALTDVLSFSQQLDIDVRHVEDPTMESIAVEYNTDGGVEFIVGHRMPNRKAVLTTVKNYSIRRNAEYKIIESDRLKLRSGGRNIIGKSIQKRIIKRISRGKKPNSACLLPPLKVLLCRHDRILCGGDRDLSLGCEPGSPVIIPLLMPSRPVLVLSPRTDN
ncbi:hypothetical protein PIB30_024007 [Stylosanthes scabra]|uniref:Uncharacterized protein n=1 Tax=Stylosanthes scabra TaxID=79078 RepID=A0ABU6Z691_9FABA|nr:hypothetical protein [Stylosanthes scabra]